MLHTTSSIANPAFSFTYYLDTSQWKIFYSSRFSAATIRIDFFFHFSSFVLLRFFFSLLLCVRQMMVERRVNVRSRMKAKFVCAQHHLKWFNGKVGNWNEKRKNRAIRKSRHKVTHYWVWFVRYPLVIFVAHLHTLDASSMLWLSVDCRLYYVVHKLHTYSFYR